MLPALYDRLVPWYRLLDPLADHADEAAVYADAFRAALGPGGGTLLELGAGAGHNAFFLKRGLRCTLTDPSPPMLALSRAINPECEHVVGDMRTLGLGRTFDAVFLHDAIVYMTTEAELRAAIATAFRHTRPGGVAIIAPDCTRESFVEQTQLYEGAEGARALRCVEWSWDPDPDDTTCVVDYAFLLRDGADLEVVHDRHLEGLFDRATWARVLQDAGFVVHTIVRPLDDVAVPAAYTDEVFVARRPAGA